MAASAPQGDLPVLELLRRHAAGRHEGPHPLCPACSSHRHLPGLHDQKTHGGGGGKVGKIAKAVGKLADSPDGGADDGPPAKLTDKEYQAHTAMVETRIGDALHNGAATDAQFGIDVDRGVWQAKRARIHKEIVNDLYGRADGVPSEGKVVVSGGLGGAGKSTVLKGHAGVDTDKYLTLNPDDIKEEMAARGLIPKVEGLSPMESAALIHEESSHIASLLAKRAYADRKNVIWDITMASEGSVRRRIKELRAAGYDDMSAVFVDIPVETSVSRALARHRRGMEDYRAGKGPGGRYVPPAIIRKNKSSTASSANREVFEKLRAEFDRWSLYDNSGSAPKLVGTG